MSKRVCVCSVAILALVLFVASPTWADSGTWIYDGSDNWSVASRWSGNVVADGADNTADFSTVNITANRTVTLNSSRSIGHLKFGDATTASHDWTLASSGGSILTLDVSSGSPTIDVVNRTATISAVLAGDDGLYKTGAGKLALSATNTYTGVTTIGAGTLSINLNSALGGDTSAVLLGATSGSDDATLEVTAGVTISRNITVQAGSTGTATITAPSGNFNPTFSGSITLNKDVVLRSDKTGGWSVTFSGVISGDGGITYSGPSSSRIFVTGTNTYTGTTTIESGDVRINANAALGDATSDVLLGATSGSKNAYLYATAGVTISRNITVQTGSTGTATIGPAGNVSPTFSGNIALNKNLIVTAQGNAYTTTLSGAISGPAGLVVETGWDNSKPGNIVLSGNNTYDGGTEVKVGKVIVNDGSSLGTGPVQMNDAVKTSILFYGNCTIDSLAGQGTVYVGHSSTAGTKTLTIGDASNTSSTFYGTIANNASNRIGALVKTGTGTLHLLGTNSYTGKTTVSQGTLLVDGLASTTANGGVEVASGATFGGTGAVAGHVTVNAGGFLSPGLSPGAQTYADGLTINGTYVWELGALSESNPGVDYDIAYVTGGALNIGEDDAVLQILFTGTATNPDSGDPFWQSDRSWVIIDSDVTRTGIFADLNIVQKQWSIGYFSVEPGNPDTNDVVLKWTYDVPPVPEPAGLSLVGLALLGLKRRRRG